MRTHARRGIAVVGLLVAAAGPVAAQEAEGRRPLSDLGSGVAALAKDTWDVVTFPTRLDRAGWLRLSGVVAVGGALYAVDEEISEALERNRELGLRRGIREVGDFFEPVGLMGNTNRFYVAGILVGYATGWKPLQHVAQDILFSHYVAGLTRNALRGVVGRARPEAGLGAREFGVDGGTSFPSGHASSIFQVAAVLSHHLDRPAASVLLYAAAASVAFQRVDGGAHWASDVWIGSAWGLAVSRVVLRNADARRGRVRPIVDPVTGAAGLSITVR